MGLLSPKKGPFLSLYPIISFGYLVTVGMPVTQHPPYRSVREELPHTAPTAGHAVRRSRATPGAGGPIHLTLAVGSGSDPRTIGQPMPVVTGLPSRRSAAPVAVRARRPQAEGSQSGPFGCPVGSQSRRHRRSRTGRLCSRRSSVLCRCQTSRRRTRQAFGHRPSLTDPIATYDAARRVPTGSPGSRTWSVHACSGSSTPRGR